VSRELQLDPKGRLDLLAVRLLECTIKAKLGAPADSRLSLDLLQTGEMVANHLGYRAWPSLRENLMRVAAEYGVSTDQTIPELARSLGLLRGRRARARRRARCTR
jgi:hypothetical protein